MWLENKRYRQIRTALHSGTNSELDRVLHDIAANEQDLPKAPTRCPVCHKELKRRTLPYLEFFGAACPDFHGWWLSPEISKKLRDFIRDQISVGVKKARQFKIVALLIAGIAGFVFLNGFFPKAFQFSPKTSEIVLLMPMPSRSPAVTSDPEWAYLLTAASALENGITGRLGFESALRRHSSAEDRWKAFNLYRGSQEQLLEKMRAISVPEKLQDFHRRLSRIFENQIVFYALMTDTANPPSGNEREDAKHPALKTLHRDLTAAYDLIVKLYPSLDPQTRAALQERLFSLEGP